MSERNQVEQIIKLDSKQYQDELKRARTQTLSDVGQINRTMQGAGSVFRDYTEFVKKNSSSLMETLKDVGKSFSENLGRGALAGGTVFGLEAFRSQTKQAISTGMDFGKSLAALASRADLSQAKIKQLREEFGKLGQTGANLESLPGALNRLYGATGDIDQSRAVMAPIAKAAAMGDGNAEQVAEFVIERLKGEGRAINSGNVGSLIQSLVSAQRGGEFGSMEDAMHAMMGVSGAVKRRAGLTDRQYAAILAGSTRVGATREVGTGAASALIKLSQEGFHADGALAGLLGVSGFSKNGHFDVNQLGAAAANFQKRRGGLGDSELIKLFSSGGGMSAEDATGLLALLKDFDKFKAGMDRVNADTKTTDQAWAETTDDLSDKLKIMRSQMVTGFDEIMEPLEHFAKTLASGGVVKSMKELPKDVADVAKGIAAHPLLTGGFLASTAAGGAILKKMGLLESGGTAMGMAKGLAMKQAGVTPVYVVNFGEVGKAAGGVPSDMTSGFLKKMEEMAMGTGGIAGKPGAFARIRGMLAGGVAAIPGIGGYLGSGVGALAGGGVGGIAALGGGVLAAGGVGALLGSYINDNLIEPGMKGTALDKSIQDLVVKMSEMIGLLPKVVEPREQKVSLEVHSQDPRFTAIPRAGDRAVDARHP